MTLTRKTLLIFIAAQLLLSCVLYFTARSILFKDFVRVEQQRTNENVDRSVNALLGELESFDVKFTDWADWDDMYQYAEDKNKRFENATLDTKVFIVGRFNLLAVIDTEGRYVFKRVVDTAKEKDLSVAAAEFDTLKETAVLLSGPSFSPEKGIYEFDGKPMLIAMRPIRTTDSKGPVHGLLVVGRFIDGDMIKRIAADVQLPVSIAKYRSYTETKPAETKNDRIRDARTCLSGGKKSCLKTNGPHSISGYALVNDLHGKPSLIIGFEQPRDIMDNARRSLSILFATMALIGGGIIVFAIVILNNNVLSPIRTLMTEIENVTDKGNPKLRISLGRGQELGKLTESLNKMLTALEKSGEALRESEERLRAANESLEARVLERTSELEESNRKLRAEFKERERAEIALRESEQKYRALVETTATGFVIIDNTGKVFDANDEYARMTGHKSAIELIGRSVLEWTSTDDKNNNERTIMECFLEGYLRNFQVNYVGPSGATIPVELNATVVETEEGARALTLCRDITERKITEAELILHKDYLEEMVEERTIALREAQNRLMAAERLAVLGQFSGNVAHEIRNPLCVIDASVFILNKLAGESDPKLRKYTERIKREIDKCSSVIDGILRMTRPERTDLVHVNVLECLRESLKTGSMNESISVVWKNEDDVTVMADREQLRIAFKNLITNAIQAMPSGGTLTLGVHRHDNGALVTISDTGCGIAPSDLQRIFEPLYSTKTWGMGFGLAIVKMAIERHGGEVHVTSELGKGTMFRIMLPYSETDPEQATMNSDD